MPQPVKISVIIPAYNEQELLTETIESARAACEALANPYEIIVANNNSTDDTGKIAADCGAKVVLETHQQIAANRNAGGRAATGEWLIFLDADTTLSPELVAAAAKALEAGCVGGGALPVFDREVRGLPKLMMHAWHLLSRWQKWACGAFVFCRKDAFEQVGGFDERYYCSEEIHFSKALQKWGKKQNREVVILDLRLTTSGRKLEWFTPWQTIRIMAGLFIPGAMRRQNACAFWYERPQKQTESK